MRRRKFLRSTLLAVAILATPLSALAADRVFECKDANGKTTYTNVPCEGQALKPEAHEDSAYKSPYGVWLGQVQLKETTTKGAAAHAVAPLTIMVEAGGKLTGASNETGCHLLGIASPSPATPNLLNLDATLTGCQDAGFSRHYNGSLALYPAQRYMQLMLLSPPRPGDAPVATHDLTGTMRR
jgi:hypothetical protein